MSAETAWPARPSQRTPRAPAPLPPSSPSRSEMSSPIEGAPETPSSASSVYDDDDVYSLRRTQGATTRPGGGTVGRGLKAYGTERRRPQGRREGVKGDDSGAYDSHDDVDVNDDDDHEGRQPSSRITYSGTPLTPDKVARIAQAFGVNITVPSLPPPLHLQPPLPAPSGPRHHYPPTTLSLSSLASPAFSTFGRSKSRAHAPSASGDHGMAPYSANSAGSYAISPSSWSASASASASGFRSTELGEGGGSYGVPSAPFASFGTRSSYGDHPASPFPYQPQPQQSHSLPPRLFISIVPPTSLAPRKNRRGELLALHPTFDGQVRAVAQAFGLPSTVGIVLFLMYGEEASDPAHAGPTSMRVGKETWGLLWGELFEGQGGFIDHSRPPSSARLSHLSHSPASSLGTAPAPPPAVPHRSPSRPSVARSTVAAPVRRPTSMYEGPASTTTRDDGEVSSPPATTVESSPSPTSPFEAAQQQQASTTTTSRAALFSIHPRPSTPIASSSLLTRDLSTLPPADTSSRFRKATKLVATADDATSARSNSQFQQHYQHRRGPTTASISSTLSDPWTSMASTSSRGGNGLPPASSHHVLPSATAAPSSIATTAHFTPPPLRIVGTVEFDVDRSRGGGWFDAWLERHQPLPSSAGEGEGEGEEEREIELLQIQTHLSPSTSSSQSQRPPLTRGSFSSPDHEDGDGGEEEEDEGMPLEPPRPRFFRDEADDLSSSSGSGTGGGGGGEWTDTGDESDDASGYQPLSDAEDAERRGTLARGGEGDGSRHERLGELDSESEDEAADEEGYGRLGEGSESGSDYSSEEEGGRDGDPLGDVFPSDEHEWSEMRAVRLEEEDKDAVGGLREAGGLELSGGELSRGVDVSKQEDEEKDEDEEEEEALIQAREVQAMLLARQEEQQQEEALQSSTSPTSPNNEDTATPTPTPAPIRAIPLTPQTQTRLSLGPKPTPLTLLASPIALSGSGFPQLATSPGGSGSSIIGGEGSRAAEMMTLSPLSDSSGQGLAYLQPGAGGSSTEEEDAASESTGAMSAALDGAFGMVDGDDEDEMGNKRGSAFMMERSLDDLESALQSLSPRDLRIPIRNRSYVPSPMSDLSFHVAPTTTTATTAALSVPVRSRVSADSDAGDEEELKESLIPSQRLRGPATVGKEEREFAVLSIAESFMDNVHNELNAPRDVPTTPHSSRSFGGSTMEDHQTTEAPPPLPTTEPIAPLTRNPSQGQQQSAPEAPAVPSPNRHNSASSPLASPVDSNETAAIGLGFPMPPSSHRFATNGSDFTSASSPRRPSADIIRSATTATDIELPLQSPPLREIGVGEIYPRKVSRVPSPNGGPSPLLARLSMAQGATSTGGASGLAAAARSVSPTAQAPESTVEERKDVAPKRRGSEASTTGTVRSSSSIKSLKALKNVKWGRAGSVSANSPDSLEPLKSTGGTLPPISPPLPPIPASSSSGSVNPDTGLTSGSLPRPRTPSFSSAVSSLHLRAGSTSPSPPSATSSRIPLLPPSATTTGTAVRGSPDLISSSTPALPPLPLSKSPSTSPNAGGVTSPSSAGSSTNKNKRFKTPFSGSSLFSRASTRLAGGLGRGEREPREPMPEKGVAIGAPELIAHVTSEQMMFGGKTVAEHRRRISQQHQQSAAVAAQNRDRAGSAASSGTTATSTTTTTVATPTGGEPPMSPRKELKRKPVPSPGVVAFGDDSSLRGSVDGSVEGRSQASSFNEPSFSASLDSEFGRIQKASEEATKSSSIAQKPRASEDSEGLA